MSVKNFLDKYFKPEAPKRLPEEVLEPMIGTQKRYEAPYSLGQLEVKHNPFHLFTDGACSSNGKRGAKGGFGVHVYANPKLDISSPLFEHEPQTNNRAELRAIQAALDLIDQHEQEWLKTHTSFYIWSDSEYSIHSLKKWAKGWQAHGWKKSDGGIIQNLDLIKPLYERLQRHPRVSLHHVRGHQDSKRNEFPFDGNFKADQLARRGVPNT